MSEKTFTLVTGASNGIGKAMAEDCAARGFNVLLVALPEPKLEKMAETLQAMYPNQEFHAFGADLSQKDSAQALYNWCRSNQYSVNILINNAGLGNSGPFLSREAEFYFRQMQLNMVALVMLTHYFLPMLKERSKAYILNVASMAAFYDIPYKSIYSASKKFVYSFSRSLRIELKNTNVSITVLCPAAVPTNPDVIRRDEEMGRIAKLTRQTPEYVATYALKRMFRGKPVAIPGIFPKLYKALGMIVPARMKLKLLANAFIKQSR